MESISPFNESTPASSSDDEENDIDEGPFFDLQLTVPFAGEEAKAELNSRLADAEDEKDFNFGEISDPKTQQLPVSLLKSATKLRVFILGLRKPKSKQRKLLFVSFNIEEVPIKAKPQITNSDSDKDSAAAAQDKKSSNSKELVQKYLSKIKPLYIRVSKKYSDKLRLTGEEKLETESDKSVKEKSQKLAISARFKVVCEKLGKNRTALTPSQRRDDSLIQLQDGIQGAIAHCKLSFKADSKEAEAPLLGSESGPGA